MERQVTAKVQKNATSTNHVEAKSVRSPSSGAHSLLELQRSIGNEAVQRLITSPYIQRKLQVGDQSGQPRLSGDAPAVVHDVLRSTGQPLDASTRGFMEPRLGHDFSRTRIHSDERAAEAAATLNAAAFTAGQHVVFNRGQYAPESQSGRHLLAHELAHVTQQTQGTVRTKIQRSRLRDFADPARPEFEPAVLTDAQIEATNEFRAYMDPALLWQATEHMTRFEARLACRLILQDIRAGVAVNWQTGARIYMNRARAMIPTARPADQRVSPPGPEATLPDTGLATELGYELDPSSRPPPAAPPPPPPAGGPAPPPPPPPARIPWDGREDPAAANPAVETARAAAARTAMQRQLFDAYDAYLTAFRPATLRALANRVPFTAPAAAAGPGPAPTGVVDIANQARDVLETRYATTMDAAAPSAGVTAGRAPRTAAPGAQNIFDATSEADRITLTGTADLAPGVAWWLFENDRPGVRVRGTKEFATVVLSNHHYSAADDPGGAFRWAVANAYAADTTLAPNNHRQLIDYRLTGWSEADPSGAGRGFTVLSSFDPGVNAGRAELVQRWNIFKTATHESLHLRAHPAFDAADQGRGTMKEGFTEMFTVSTLNGDVLPRVRAGSMEPLRRTVEGSLSPAAPDAGIITNSVTPAQYAEHLDAAVRIRDGGTPPGGSPHAGVGEAAVRAAYFQGHVEYIGLAPGGAQAAGLRAPGVPQQTRIPGGMTNLNDLARRSRVPRPTIEADNPGITNALPATAVLRGCREHRVIAGESRANIATQHGVSELDLVLANPDIALNAMTNAWPALAAGQVLLIPAH